MAPTEKGPGLQTVTPKPSQVDFTSPLDMNLLSWGRGRNDMDLTWPFVSCGHVGRSQWGRGRDKLLTPSCSALEFTSSFQSLLVLCIVS